MSIDNKKKTHSLTREHRGILCTRTYSIQAQIKFWNAVHRMKTIAIHTTTLKYIKWNEQIKFNCFRTFNTIEWSKTIDKVKQAHRMAAKFDEHHQMDGFLVKIQCELNNCVCVCLLFLFIIIIILLMRSQLKIRKMVYLNGICRDNCRRIWKRMPCKSIQIQTVEFIFCEWVRHMCV